LKFWTDARFEIGDQMVFFRLLPAPLASAEKSGI